MKHGKQRRARVSREEVWTCEERWSVGEANDNHVAVRDMHGSLVAWVLPEDGALVAAAPALLGALRALLDKGREGQPCRGRARHVEAAKALVDALDRAPVVCPGCDGIEDPIAVCEGCGGSGIRASRPSSRS